MLDICSIAESIKDDELFQWREVRIVPNVTLAQLDGTSNMDILGNRNGDSKIRRERSE